MLLRFYDKVLSFVKKYWYLLLLGVVLVLAAVFFSGDSGRISRIYRKLRDKVDILEKEKKEELEKLQKEKEEKLRIEKKRHEAKLEILKTKYSKQLEKLKKENRKRYEKLKDSPDELLVELNRYLGHNS